MIIKQYIVECDKCGKLIGIYNHYKPSLKQLRKCCGIVVINNSKPRLICKDCIKHDDRQ